MEENKSGRYVSDDEGSPKFVTSKMFQKEESEKCETLRSESEDKDLMGAEMVQLDI
jgi:hypothetical protein